MYLKIYTADQLLLLQNLNPLLKQRIPGEVLRKITSLMVNKEMGDKKYIALIVSVVHYDPLDIWGELRLERTKAESLDEYFQIIRRGKKKTWFLSAVQTSAGETIYVIFSRKTKEVDAEE